MSRQAGSGKAQVEARKGAEQLSFNLRFCADELVITRLRIQQAMRREPSLVELLAPGEDEINRVIRWLREVTPDTTGGGGESPAVSE